jgi:CRISPR-associated protein Csx17
MRNRHLLLGLRPEPLASYLAGLGLIRVLGEQADPDASAAWAPGGLAVNTTVEDIAAWLADSYVPTPVLSPWNSGSGFGTKDKEPRVRLQALRDHPSPRLAPFRAALSLAEQVIEDALAAGWLDDKGNDGKRRMVLELRNRCPEELIAWIDAAIVLTGDQWVFPSLLGTGGNDGRTDFSTHFHKCLLEVIDTPRSVAVARDLLAGTETEQLASAAIGQFDPAGAGGPGSSKFGAADYLVNPWRYVLCVEGTLLFASSAVRRNQFAAGQAAMPFTVDASPDGSASGSARENSRREVWAPLWSQDVTVPEIKQLFAEARASWRGRPARRAADFYAATRLLGVSRGIDRFTRFGLYQRNGQSHTAVLLDRIDVRERAEVRLAAEVEDWANRFGGTDTSAAVREAARRFSKAHLEYARDGGPGRLAAMLAAVTSLEQAAGRSGRARDSVPVRYAPPAGRFLDELAKDESPELRVAAGLASCQTLAGTGPSELPVRAMRQLLLPVDPRSKSHPNGQWRDSPLIPGFGARSLTDVLASVLVWRCRTAADEPGAERFRGVPGFRAGVRVPAADLHAFARGALDDRKLDLMFRACLALEWRNVRRDWSPAGPWTPVPALGVLQPLADGLRPGFAAAGGESEEPELALNPGWVAQLAAGKAGEVHREAAARLRQAGWEAVPAPPVNPPGSRIAAALVPRCLNTRLVLPEIAVPIRTREFQELS